MRLTPRKMDYTNDADLTECNSTTSKRDMIEWEYVVLWNWISLIQQAILYQLPSTFIASVRSNARDSGLMYLTHELALTDNREGSAFQAFTVDTATTITTIQPCSLTHIPLYLYRSNTLHFSTLPSYLQISLSSVPRHRDPTLSQGLRRIPHCHRSRRNHDSK